MAIHPIDFAVIFLHFGLVLSIGFIRSKGTGQTNMRISCIVMIYAAIFTLGKFLLCSPGAGLVSLLVFGVSLVITVKAVRRMTSV